MNTITQTEKLVWIYGLILFGLGLVLAIVNPEYFDHTYTLEDGLLEWLTVLALGTIAATSIRRLYEHHNKYIPLQRFIIALTALLFIFGTGEEISWGQRLFAIESPEFFQNNNAQQETNLHNLVVGDTKINKLVFGKIVALMFFIYLAILTPLHRRGGTPAQWIDALAIPIPTRLQWWGFVGIVILVEGVIQLLSDTPKRGELTEFGASITLMLTVLYPSNLKSFEPNHKRQTNLKKTGANAKLEKPATSL